MFINKIKMLNLFQIKVKINKIKINNFNIKKKVILFN